MSAVIFQEVECWHKSMLMLQSLLDNASWADTGYELFAKHLCGDLLQRMQAQSGNKAACLQIPVDGHDKRASGSETGGKKKRPPPLDEDRNESRKTKKQMVTCTALSTDGFQWRSTTCSSKRTICETDGIARRLQIGERSGIITNQFITTKENAQANDGLYWRKDGNKQIKYMKYPSVKDPKVEYGYLFSKMHSKRKLRSE